MTQNWTHQSDLQLVWTSKILKMVKISNTLQTKYVTSHLQVLFVQISDHNSPSNYLTISVWLSTQYCIPSDVRCLQCIFRLSDRMLHLASKSNTFTKLEVTFLSLVWPYWLRQNSFLTLIYPAHFEDVPCQSGVNHIFEG